MSSLATLPPTEVVGTRPTVSRYVPAGILAVLALLVLIAFGVFGPTGSSTFTFATKGDAFALPPAVLPSAPAAIVIGILLLGLAAFSAWGISVGRKIPKWAIAVFIILFVVALITWAIAGKSIPTTPLLQGSLTLAVPLIFGALSGVICERVGVVNIAIEGQLLAGAFGAAVAASLTDNLYVGLIAACISGALVSAILAVFAVVYLVDQVIVGVVLNVFVLGLTSFLTTEVLDAESNSPPRFQPIELPGLSQIPILGPLLFQQTLVIYLMFAVLALVTIGLFRTRWGLRLRAVGEHPQAADTVGIKVGRTRLLNVMLGGAIAGLGGSFFTIGSIGAFKDDMTAGAGFIALAALIFGRWNPLLATAAALLFGFARNLQAVLSIVGSPIPSQFLLMLPYVVTIFAVAGFAGRVRGPAAAGTPYLKS